MIAAVSDKFQTPPFFSWHVLESCLARRRLAGLEGGLRRDGDGRHRASIGDDPVRSRGLALARADGHNQFYFSGLRPPIGEMATSISPTAPSSSSAPRRAGVTGRYDTGNRTRRELAEAASSMAAIVARMRASAARRELHADRRTDNVPGGNVSVLRGRACGFVVERVAVCGDGMYINGAGILPPFIPTNVKSINASHDRLIDSDQSQSVETSVYVRTFYGVRGVSKRPRRADQNPITRS